MEWLDAFDYAYAQRALMASVFVGITCGVLGSFIVLRNMAMIGDALSHAVLPGVVAGFLVAGYSLVAFFVGSVLAGLATALLIAVVQQRVRTKPDSAIGIVFSAMFALGILGISYVTRQEGVHLDMKDFLFGNVLGIHNQDLYLTGLIMVFVVLCVWVFYRYFFITTFDPTAARTLGIRASTMHYFLMILLSFAVVASLQTVGVILVVAMLVIPANTAYLLTNRLHIMLVLSAVLGVLASVVGLFVAVYFDTAPGPAMTLVSAMLYVLVAVIAPKRKGIALRKQVRAAA